MTPEQAAIQAAIQSELDAITARHGTIPVPRICYHGELSHQCWDCPRWQYRGRGSIRRIQTGPSIPLETIPAVYVAAPRDASKPALGYSTLAEAKRAIGVKSSVDT